MKAEKTRKMVDIDFYTTHAQSTQNFRSDKFSGTAIFRTNKDSDKLLSESLSRQKLSHVVQLHHEKRMLFGECVFLSTFQRTRELIY